MAEKSRFLIVLLLLPLGCFSVKHQVRLNPDGSGDLTIILHDPTGSSLALSMLDDLSDSQEKKEETEALAEVKKFLKGEGKRDAFLHNIHGLLPHQVPEVRALMRAFVQETTKGEATLVRFNRELIRVTVSPMGDQKGGHSGPTSVMIPRIVIAFSFKHIKALNPLWSKLGLGTLRWEDKGAHDEFVWELSLEQLPLPKPDQEKKGPPKGEKKEGMEGLDVAARSITVSLLSIQTLQWEVEFNKDIVESNATAEYERKAVWEYSLLDASKGRIVKELRARVSR